MTCTFLLALKRFGLWRDLYVYIYYFRIIYNYIDAIMKITLRE